MSEQPPTSEAPGPIFASTRDQVLYRMAIEQWACESTGDIQAAASWLCWLSNSPAELADILDAFRDDIDQAQLADPQQLVGNFLMTQNNRGYVEVAEYETEDAVREAYTRLAPTYGESPNA